ncbi:hypothetical protein EIP91_005089, partial [Steccherinum ochraceum]
MPVDSESSDPARTISYTPCVPYSTGLTLRPGIMSTSDIPTNPSPQLKVALNYLDAIAHRDIVQVKDVLAPDCVSTVLPAGLGFPPIRGLDAILELYSGSLPHFTSFEFTVHEITEVPGKVIIHASSDAHTTF